MRKILEILGGIYLRITLGKNRPANEENISSSAKLTRDHLNQIAFHIGSFNKIPDDDRKSEREKAIDFLRSLIPRRSSNVQNSAPIGPNGDNPIGTLINDPFGNRWLIYRNGHREIWRGTKYERDSSGKLVTVMVRK